MTEPTDHHLAETRFRDLLAEAGLPEPDECAHFRRALVFLWHASKAIVLIDLDELPDGAEPLAGFNAGLLAEDVLGDDELLARGWPGGGFAEAG